LAAIRDGYQVFSITPVSADSKRISRNIYARTREEYEEKLAVMIEEVKREIAAEKEKMKAVNQ
jgi:hypothetical protein